MKECLYGKVYQVQFNKMKHRAKVKKKKITKKASIHDNCIIYIIYIILHFYVNKYFIYLCTYMVLDN